MSREALRKLVIDFLDDNYHFGDAESLIGGDEDKSFLRNGILDSLGFVRLVLLIETRCGVQIDRKALSPQNFDSLKRICEFTTALATYRSPT
jgi:acyl carrier protein